MVQDCFPVGRHKKLGLISGCSESLKFLKENNAFEIIIIKKLVVTTHFSKIIKLQFGKYAIHWHVQSSPFIADTLGTARIRNSGNLFQSTSVIYINRGFSCCPYYLGVRDSEVSARRELTRFVAFWNYRCLVISEKCMATPNSLFGFKYPLLRCAFPAYLQTAQKYLCCRSHRA